jgi:hypothetical protein
MNMNPNPPPSPGGYPSNSPSVCSRGRYNATAIMLVDVPNMNDDDALMASSCSSRGSGSRDGGGSDSMMKKCSDEAVASAAARSRMPLHDRIQYIELKDDDGGGGELQHEIDEIATVASSSASLRNHQHMKKGNRSGRLGVETNSTGRIKQSKLQYQQQQEHEQKQQIYTLSSKSNESNNEFGTRRQLQNSLRRQHYHQPQLAQPQQQPPRRERHQHENREENQADRPVSRMKNGDKINIPRGSGKTTDHGNISGSSIISRNSAIFEILWGQDGIYNENGAITTVGNNLTTSSNHSDRDDDDDDSEYYCDGTIRRRGIKKVGSTMRLENHRTKIHHRCQKLFSSCGCSVRLPTYLTDDLGIVKPITALSCGFVCFAAVMTIGILIALSVSHHVVHKRGVEIGGEGVAGGVSYTLSVAEIASMSNADRLIFAERIDHICDKRNSTSIVGNYLSSEDSDGGGGECWSFCREKQCCFVGEGSRRRLSDTATKDEHSIPLSQRRTWLRIDVFEQNQQHEHRLLQLAQTNIPGETDFTYIAHKVHGSNTNTKDTETASGESENCVNDPDEFCMVYAGCAPLFGK